MNDLRRTLAEYAIGICRVVYRCVLEVRTRAQSCVFLRICYDLLCSVRRPATGQVAKLESLPQMALPKRLATAAGFQSSFAGEPTTQPPHPERSRRMEEAAAALSAQWQEFTRGPGTPMTQNPVQIGLLGGPRTIPCEAVQGTHSTRCSLAKSCRPSNLFSPASGMLPESKLQTLKRSRSAISCSSGLARMITGAPASCWSVRCVRQARYAARSYVPIVVRGEMPGIATRRLKSPRSEVLPTLNHRWQSALLATGPYAQVAITFKNGSRRKGPKSGRNRGVCGGCSGRDIRYRHLIPAVPQQCWLAVFRADNEHYVSQCRSP